MDCFSPVQKHHFKRTKTVKRTDLRRIAPILCVLLREGGMKGERESRKEGGGGERERERERERETDRQTDRQTEKS